MSDLEREAPCGLVAMQPDGTIADANEAFCGLTGRSREDLIGKTTFSQLLTGGGRIYHETHFAPLLQMQGNVRSIALEIARPDGERVPVLVNAVLEYDDAGDPAVARAAVFEATERRSYERELLRAKEDAERAEQKSAALARTLQQTLIPPLAPEIPGLEVTALYRPAGAGTEVGGDFFDVFQIDDDDWVVVIGDVQGKGAAAAVVTALVRHTVRAAAVLEQDPTEILDTVNTVLLRSDSERFCTVGVMRMMRVDRTWRAVIGLGGHTQPILSRRGHVPAQVGEPGMLLGVWAEAETTNSVILLEPGDIIVMYTDGVTEGRSGDEFFGESRLLALVEANSGNTDTLVHAILDEAVAFQSGITRDDIVVVGVGLPDH